MLRKRENKKNKETKIGGAINPAGDAFTETRLVPAFPVFNRPSRGASPAEGRRCSTRTSVEGRKAGV